MTAPDTATWCSIVRTVAAHARMTRLACPVAVMDQAASRLRDHADVLGVDLHDRDQRKALAMGVLLEAQCGPGPHMNHAVSVWAALEEWGTW